MLRHANDRPLLCFCEFVVFLTVFILIIRISFLFLLQDTHSIIELLVVLLGKFVVGVLSLVWFGFMAYQPLEAI